MSYKVTFSCFLQLCPQLHPGMELSERCPCCVYLSKVKTPFQRCEVSSFYEVVLECTCISRECENCRKALRKLNKYYILPEVEFPHRFNISFLLSF